MRCVLFLVVFLFQYELSYSSEPYFSDYTGNPSFPTRASTRETNEMEPPPSTMYLKRQIKKVDPEALLLFERCLLTYFWVNLAEKNAPLDEALKLQLETKTLSHSGKLENYSLDKKASSLINKWLPDSESKYFNLLRQSLIKLWPTLNLQLAVSKLGERYPLAAEYIDYLFNRSNNAIQFQIIYTSVIQNCKGCLNEIELLILCSIHILGSDGISNFELAIEEAEKLDHSGTSSTARLMLDLYSRKQ